jgi:hypothetical protein
VSQPPPARFNRMPRPKYSVCPRRVLKIFQREFFRKFSKGRYYKEMKFQPLQLEGQVFTRLTVIRRADQKHGNWRWLCRCECGNETVVAGGSLRGGKSRSCGCLRRETTSRTGKLVSTGRTTPTYRTHGQAPVGKSTPTYRTWAAMIQRCTNPNRSNWKYYGGRGVTVCERWLNSFESFLADMGPRPDGENISIGRFGDVGNYEPGNVKWMTPKEQYDNRVRK